jgi:hypothetical protein
MPDATREACEAGDSESENDAVAHVVTVALRDVIARLRRGWVLNDPLRRVSDYGGRRYEASRNKRCRRARLSGQLLGVDPGTRSTRRARLVLSRGWEHVLVKQRPTGSAGDRPAHLDEASGRSRRYRVTVARKPASLGRTADRVARLDYATSNRRPSGGRTDYDLEPVAGTSALRSYA